jgi:guanylate kinase
MYLNCWNNQLTSLEGIENLIKLIKNNKQIKNKKNNIMCNFIDADDYIELKNLFKNLIDCKKNKKVNKLIEKIEEMIIKLNGFEKYVLK